jgi:hypothetical protein
MRNSSFTHSARPLLAMLALVAFDSASVQAEDVIVTATIDGSGTTNTCPPSCCDNLGTSTTTAYYSTAIPAGIAPRKSRYANSRLATWTVMPLLGSTSGAYKVYVSKGTSISCPSDIHVKIVATSGCLLYDTNGVAAPSGVDTTAFQADASLHVWTPVAIITNSSATPAITFSWASGGFDRWYMDEVRFENLAPGTATPARITQILYDNPITLSGTGPVSHTFALVSSTNAAKALNQWTLEQTDIAGSGSFTFSITPGAAKARFFRVITQ